MTKSQSVWQQVIVDLEAGFPSPLTTWLALVCPQKQELLCCLLGRDEMTWSRKKGSFLQNELQTKPAPQFAPCNPQVWICRGGLASLATVFRPCQDGLGTFEWQVEERNISPSSSRTVQGRDLKKIPQSLLKAIDTCRKVLGILFCCFPPPG